MLIKYPRLRDVGAVPNMARIGKISGLGLGTKIILHVLAQLF